MNHWTSIAGLVCAGALATHAQTVAVLPFANASAPGIPQVNNLDWLGESIAETLREAFGTRGVLSIERDDIEEAYQKLRLKRQAKLTDASVLKLGEAVDVEHVLSGSFQFTPAPAGAGETKGTLKITARVIDRRRLRQGPELAEMGDLEDLAKLEAHLAWKALSALAPKLAPPEKEYASLRPSIRLDAEENYVRGLLAAADDQEKYFKQAATLDIHFMLPCVELGKIYYRRKQFRDAATWLERVGPADFHFREASFLLGLVRFEMLDYPGSQKAFQGIVTTVPLAEVYNNLAATESRRNMPQAVDDFRKALVGDPSDRDYLFNLGYALWKRGDFTGAADQFRAVLVRDPDDQMATLLLGRCLKKQWLKLGDTKGPDARFQSLERLKTKYDERAYWQLKSTLEAKPE